MSLKAFHIVFVLVSVIFGLSLGVWGVADYLETRSISHLLVGVSGFAASVALGWYGSWFLKKMKGVGYL